MKVIYKEAIILSILRITLFTITLWIIYSLWIRWERLENYMILIAMWVFIFIRKD